MTFDVYAIGVCLYHYDFRSFKKPGDLTLRQEGHRPKDSCFKPALFFQMWVICADVVICSTGKHVG